MVSRLGNSDLGCGIYHAWCDIERPPERAVRCRLSQVCQSPGEFFGSIGPIAGLTDCSVGIFQKYPLPGDPAGVANIVRKLLFMTDSLRLATLTLGALVIGLAVGCGESEPPPPMPSSLVMVTGKVTLDGQPLEGAMLIFFPQSTGGVMGYGVTDSTGNYAMETRGADGPVPGIGSGSYRVMVSRFLKPDGTAPLDPSEPPANSGARESLPPQYSSPTDSKLRAVVGASGGQFNFDVKSK